MTIFRTAALLISLIVGFLAVSSFTPAQGATIYLDIDGETKAIETRAPTVEGVLEEEGIALDRAQAVVPSLSSPVASGSRIVLRTPREVTATVAVGIKRFTTFELTYGAALDRAGIAIPPGARTSKSLASIIPKAGGAIEIDGLKEVTLKLEGKEKTYPTYSSTLNELFQEQKIEVSSSDLVSVALDSPLSSKTFVEITRVTAKQVKQKVEVALPKVREETNSIPYGEKQIIAGKPKVVERVLSVEFEDGKHEATRVVRRKVVSRGTPRKVLVGTGMAPVDPGSAKAKAQQLMSSYGWNGKEFSCLEELWTRESQWNYQAENPSSGAYGIPQLLPSAHALPPGFKTDVGVQLAWGLDYIQGRYGSPCAALAFHDQNNWY